MSESDAMQESLRQSTVQNLDKFADKRLSELANDPCYNKKTELGEEPSFTSIRNALNAKNEGEKMTHLGLAEKFLAKKIDASQKELDQIELEQAPQGNTVLLTGTAADLYRGILEDKLTMGFVQMREHKTDAAIQSFDIVRSSNTYVDQRISAHDAEKLCIDFDRLYK